MLDTQSEDRPSLTSTISALTHRLTPPATKRGPGLPSGDRAALRRMDPSVIGEAIMPLTRLLIDAKIDAVGLERTKRWALVVHCIALAEGAHSQNARLGENLARIDLSEARLGQLLSADLDVLFDLAPRIARRIRSQGATVNWVEFARLILADPNSQAGDDIRLQIARDYASATRTKGDAE